MSDIEFGLSVVGDRAIDIRLDHFSADLRKRLHSRIALFTAALEDAVVADEPRLTGKLQAETRAFVDDTPDGVRGRVRVLTKGGGPAEGGKAAALEYGAHGSAAVKAHARRLDHVFGRMTGGLDVFVEAYSRHLDIAARRFLRGPLDAMHAEILEGLREVVDEAAGAA